MNNFETCRQKYKDYAEKINNSWPDDDFRNLDIEDLTLFFDALKDIYKNVTLPRNRELMVFGVCEAQEGIQIDSMYSILEMLKIQTIMHGVMESHPRTLSFAKETAGIYGSTLLMSIEELMEREKNKKDYVGENDENNEPKK